MPPTETGLGLQTILFPAISGDFPVSFAETPTGTLLLANGIDPMVKWDPLAADADTAGVAPDRGPRAGRPRLGQDRGAVRRVPPVHRQGRQPLGPVARLERDGHRPRRLDRVARDPGDPSPRPLRGARPGDERPDHHRRRRGAELRPRQRRVGRDEGGRRLVHDPALDHQRQLPGGRDLDLRRRDDRVRQRPGAGRGQGRAPPDPPQPQRQRGRSTSTSTPTTWRARRSSRRARTTTWRPRRRSRSPTATTTCRSPTGTASPRRTRRSSPSTRGGPSPPAT
jgi:hypothetical protein